MIHFITPKLSLIMSQPTRKMKFKLIAAVSENMGIGYKGGLPWRLKKEMQYFTDMTSRTINPDKRNAVVMGRKTWESIPPKYKPLPNRKNVIISTTMKDSSYEDVPVFRSLDEAVDGLSKPPLLDVIEDVWIIGGSMLYENIFPWNFHRVTVLKQFSSIVGSNEFSFM
nr:dihydrofolate reductase-like isoform X2 [Halyomorpha halys]